MFARDWRLLGMMAFLCSSVAAPLWAADCTDLSRREPIRVSGRLEHRTYPGPPNYEDPRKGDTPESAYMLKLDTPRCFFGDEFLDGEVDVKVIQIIVSGDDDRGLFGELKELTGSSVTVIGKDAFGVHTGHHHALVLMIVSSVSKNPAEAQGNAMTAVQGFYRALSEGDGAQAAAFIIPSKRKSGPLSAAAMSSFYGHLKKPLELLDVSAIGGGRYRAEYFFETEAGRRCEGSSVVTTVTLAGVKLISRIVAENGC